MNWLERARREIYGMPSGATVDTVEGDPTAVLAVADPHHVEIPGVSIGSNGSSSYGEMDDVEALREAFEERAAIIEYDGGQNRDGAERIAWAIVWKQRLLP